MNTVASRNIKFVSHSDQGGRGDGVHMRWVHCGYAYIGHAFSNGITGTRCPRSKASEVGQFSSVFTQYARIAPSGS